MRVTGSYYIRDNVYIYNLLELDRNSQPIVNLPQPPRPGNPSGLRPN